MAGAARAVRIRRDENPPVSPTGGITARSAAPSPAAGRHYPNSAGSSRAFRMFLLFVVGLAVIYAVFMGYAVSSAVTGANEIVEAVLTGSVVVALVVGWWVTLGQAPTLAYVEGDKLVVRERTGRTRRFPIDNLRINLLRTNADSFLGPEPTEFVELSIPRGPRRTYLVGAHFFDFAH